VLIVVALCAALAAVFWLPAQVAPPATAPDRTAVVTPPAPESTPAAARAEPAVAEQALQRYLRQRAEIDLLGAATWAGAELAAVDELVRSGDRLFGERRHAAAATRYDDATARLVALAGSRPTRLAEALEAGRAALEADEGHVAASHFTTALQLEPGHPEAGHALARAEARPAVLERMNAGRLAELADDLATAEAAYRDALQLDAEFARAEAAASRVAAERAERAFGVAMSAALQALDAGRFEAARRHLETAATLRPGERVVADARRRLAAESRSREIARLRSAAKQRVAAEAWSEAERHYAAVLELDPAAGFARAGVARAQRQLRLNARIDHYLADPTRLHASDPLAEAERLLADAAPELAGEPRLAAKVERLAAHVQAARTPRPVTLRSDGLTEVTLYHVGRFGAFAEQRLQLRPGDYTAHGARPGFRDVRVTFTVPADGTPAPVDVRCSEPL
jgi:tetratricopeptide (TPR) repeat protein